MTDEITKKDETVTIVIDPISKPLAFAKDVGKAIDKGFKTMGSKIKKAFTPKKRR